MHSFFFTRRLITFIFPLLFQNVEGPKTINIELVLYYDKVTTKCEPKLDVDSILRSKL